MLEKKTYLLRDEIGNTQTHSWVWWKMMLSPLPPLWKDRESSGQGH